MQIKKLSFWLLALAIFASSCHSGKQPTQQVSSLAASNTPVPEWSNNAVIYEVNVRQFTEEGTFNAFAEHLPRLKELGVDILWLMPIHPIGELNRKGTLGSYYSIKDYKAVNPEFGTFDDFKALVDKAHELGMKVILDWVANHTAWDNSWVTNNPAWYAKDSVGNMIAPYDWTDVVQLDYNNMEMRAAMTDALEFWVKEANIDGYRCDVAGMVPVDFWENARISLDKIKPVYMLAEDEDVKALLNNAFNSNYGWSFHHIMNSIAKGELNATDAKAYFEKADTLYPLGSYPMHFTSNHDENSWNGTEYERMEQAAKTFAALTFLIEGMPLIYTGQEAALNKRLEFFEKDKVEWADLSMTAFYQSLIQLKKENRALWNGLAGGKMKILETSAPEQILGFTREKDDNVVVAFFNLSAQSAPLMANPGLPSDSYAEYFTNREIKFPVDGQILQPWEYIVFTIHK